MLHKIYEKTDDKETPYSLVYDHRQTLEIRKIVYTINNNKVLIDGHNRPARIFAARGISAGHFFASAPLGTPLTYSPLSLRRGDHFFDAGPSTAGWGTFMILEQTGKICDGLYATGYHFMPAFLLAAPAPVLFDAGVAAMGPHYLKDLETYLGRADALEYLLLTHSHYDHCGAAPYLKEKIPGLTIGTNAHAAKVLLKPNAVGLIRALNDNFTEIFKDAIGDEEKIPFNPVEVDLVLKDGDELDCGGGWTVRVIETPGHTNDCLSYYIPKIKTLIAGEAVGVIHNGGIQPEFSSSYDDYMTSLERLVALDVEILALAHKHVLTGDDASRFLRDSIETTVSFKGRIEGYLDRFGGNREKVVETILGEDYDDTILMQQDKKSFLLNLQAQVRVVAEGK